MLGVVLSAELKLRKIETTYFRQKAIPVRDLEQMFTVLDESDNVFPYSVATLDVFASGAQLGRGAVAAGDHARLDELPPDLARKPLRLHGNPKLDVPFEFPQLTLNRLSVRLLNAAIMFVQSSAKPFGHYEGFFYPLDVFSHWNRAYGRRGFAQYQFVIPFADGLRNMRAILETIFSAGELPVLNVLKRMGKQSGGLLSFPREGYTLAIDFPVRQNTPALFKRLDKMVLDAGGRVYLGKDAFLDAVTFRAMYPEVEQFARLKATYDPKGVFTSNLARRVGLVAR
jgi:FAD/FMN-containing dehydrogenase